MMDDLQAFLESEITDQEYYEGILAFIQSPNIRSGEYECNTFIVRKINRSSFLIYEEFEVDGRVITQGETASSHDNLVKQMQECAQKQGFTLCHYP
ncbi:hypothetical protein QRD89_06685 [Halobacillus sp. ACCC02827]|uniref:hypothetical protein n=1 Tax=Bacillaceae TaxID=186817 RepID=UPI0002A4F08F|nr:MULTISPECIES: hypothetical protein [Bacillaceae]ELK45985.1 hypothetical protein D479_12118 [Halobacillus sp. BAB-2008]QHT46212.1 hypothetical protein M662_06800 [Bacillus sp. SB49]WJE17029.1 hypothetical protein QRD89_06685 [Halobacillus sp. ACCC02827]